MHMRHQPLDEKQPARKGATRYGIVLFPDDFKTRFSCLSSFIFFSCDSIHIPPCSFLLALLRHRMVSRRPRDTSSLSFYFFSSFLAVTSPGRRSFGKWARGTVQTQYESECQMRHVSYNLSVIAENVSVVWSGRGTYRPTRVVFSKFSFNCML